MKSQFSSVASQGQSEPTGSSVNFISVHFSPFCRFVHVLRNKRVFLWSAGTISSGYICQNQ